MKIAILIPTLNRIQFIIRTLKYYNQHNLIIKVYIGDSSKINYLETLKKYNFHTDYKYFHIPGKNDREAIKFLSEKVEEDYVAFSGDDDFLIPDSLIKCALFLSKNKSYRTAQGRAYTFSIINNQLYGQIKSIFPYWKKHSITEEDCIKRAIEYSKKYFVSQFSVHRSKEYAHDCNRMIDCHNRQLGEFTNCFASIINGKSKYIDCLHMIRQDHPLRGVSQISVGVESNTDFWYKNKKFHNIESFISSVRSNILENKNISNDNFTFFSNKIIKNLSKRSKDSIFKKYINLFFIYILRLFNTNHIFNTKYNFYIPKNDIMIIRKIYNFLLKE